MKQGINFSLLVDVEDIDIDSIEKIEFCFRKSPDCCTHVFKSAAYPGDVDLYDNAFRIPWKAEETFGIKHGESFYMDTRITLHDTNEQPETNLVKLVMNPTLFEG